VIGPCESRQAFKVVSSVATTATSPCGHAASCERADVHGVTFFMKHALKYHLTCTMSASDIALQQQLVTPQQGPAMLP
jgi:hypothetical protein